jgi:hypothetical protein
MRRTLVKGIVTATSAITALLIGGPTLATPPLPMPNACGPLLCVGFPLGLGEGLSVRPAGDLSADNVRTTLVARYGRGVQIVASVEKVDDLQCGDGTGEWRRLGPHRIEMLVQLAPSHFRTKEECRHLIVESAGLPAAIEPDLNVDIWLMTDYFPARLDFVEQPVEHWERVFFRDIK